MERITFKSGIFEVTMTEEEVKKMYEDIQFLEEAILKVLNPELESDLTYSHEEAMKYLKEYFMEHKGYSQDFIKLLFHKL